MQRFPVNVFNFPKYEDEDVIMAWQWFMAFLSKEGWQKRKESIERKVSMKFKDQKPFSEPLTKGTLVVIKDDVIGWYLYLIDMLINEPHKYEYFQGARVVPIFKCFGSNLETLKGIKGIEKKVKDLLKKRISEADSLLFEILTALLWKRNGYKVAFLEEKNGEKTPDIIAEKEEKTYYIECKRQSKTSDYTYKENAKRQTMISYIGETLLRRNILLDIVFHVELEKLPDTFLKDLLEHKLNLAIPGKIVSNKQVDIDLAFVDIPSIRKHLENNLVKNNSPILNYLIAGKPVDNKALTIGILADFFRIGEGEVNNLYISDINRAFGVFWRCDNKEALFAKARDIKNQLNTAIQQFSSDSEAVIHIGMETFDGPEVEKARFEKIVNTIEKIDPIKTNLRWIFCHYFQAYSPHDQYWVFDETVSTICPFYIPIPPIKNRLLIIPEDGDTADDIYHWDRELP